MSDELQFSESLEDLTEYKRQIEVMRDAAKQLISLTTVLPAIYFAVLSFSDLRKTVHGFEALPFLVPTVPWLVCQILIAQVFLPQSLPEQEQEERVAHLRKLVISFRRRLLWTYWSLVLGLILVIVLLTYYLVVVPAPV